MKTLFKLIILLTLAFTFACFQDDITTETTDGLLTEAVAAAPQAISKNCPAALYKSTDFMSYIPAGSFAIGGNP